MELLSPEFQSELVRAITQDHSFLIKHRKWVDENHFKDATEHRIVSACVTYYDKYKGSPSKMILADILARKQDFDEVMEYIQPYYNKKVDSVSYLADNLRDFKMKTNIKDTLIGCMSHLKSGDYDAILKDVRMAVQEMDDENGVGSLFFANAKNVLAAMDQPMKFVPTGISGLDEKISGGGMRGTLNVVLTPPNKGKTSTLINFGKYAVMGGFRVDHVTTELSEEIVNRRYIQSIVGMTKQELRNKKRTAYAKVLELAEKVARENLNIKRYRSYSCTVQNLENHFKQMKDVYGFFPDVCIVDYAALLKSSRDYDEKRHELSNIYANLRDVMFDNNVVGWTAHQTNRQGNQGEVITINDLAEDFGIAAITDVIVSVNQDMEERRNGDARLFLAKNRDDDSLVTIPIRVDWTKIQMTGQYD